MTLWHRLLEWYGRRSALGDLARRQREDEAHLARLDLNPIKLARIALDKGDPALAAKRWGEARVRLPNIVVESRDAPAILMELGRHGEAEELLREGQRRFPNDHFYATALALVAEHRGDFVEAAKRWESARDSSDKAMAYAHGGICLRSLGRLDEADALFDEAVRLDPESIFSWLERARIPEMKQDWREGLDRWRLLAERFNFGAGFSGQARILMRLERIDEAEAILEKALPFHPMDLEIAVTRAHVARCRGDLAREIERWAVVRRIAPSFAPGYREEARCLLEAGRHAEAEQTLCEAMARFSDEAWPFVDFARLAHEREEWDEAVLRWAVVRERFPAEQVSYSLGAEALGNTDREGEKLVPPSNA